jgi:hypothetical protein
VLAILATREGTSMTVIDNKRDRFEAGQTWGQRLFFNQHGQRASLTGKRMSDFLAGQQQNPANGQTSAQAAGQEGLNMVLLIQVPLKQRNPRPMMPMACAPMAGGGGLKSAARSDVEEAVIGHGKVEGPFTEIDNLDIERDPRFPVRVTVQFYKATSNGVVSEVDMSAIAAQINRVYSQADYVGSLVVDGPTGRPTEHTGPQFQPPGWWNEFWQRHQANTGMTPQQTIEMLRKLYGPNYVPRDEQELLRGMDRIREEQRKNP